jgi:adenosylcobinamide-phosphate synthase
MPVCVVTLLGALGLDLLLGDPPNVFHPTAWMGRFIMLTSQHNLKGKPTVQFFYGTALVLICAVVFVLPWFLLEKLHLPFWWLWTIPCMKLTFSIRKLLYSGSAVENALMQGDIELARKTVSWHLVGRDTSQLSAPLVASATIESLAENITDSVTSPLFYFALGGLPAAWAYRLSNTCDSLLGHRDHRREYLGKFAARLDDVLNWLPARLTAVSIVIAAALVGEDASNAWRTLLDQHRRTASPNAGWTMSAMAGALGVTLVNLGNYELEGGTGILDHESIHRCLRINRCSIILCVILVSIWMVILDV